MSVKNFFRVHFYETDLMGVVHHSNYIRWFETGRVEFLRKIGINLNEMIEEKILFPITEIKAKYFQPVKFDDEIELETNALTLTKIKMEFNYKIRRKNEKEILVSGYSQNVFTSMETGKIIRLPDKFFLKLQNAMNEEME